MDSVLDNSTELILGFSAQLWFMWLAFMNPTVCSFVESLWSSAPAFVQVACIDGEKEGFLLAEINAKINPVS